MLSYAGISRIRFKGISQTSPCRSPLAMANGSEKKARRGRRASLFRPRGKGIPRVGRDYFAIFRSGYRTDSTSS